MQKAVKLFSNTLQKHARKLAKFFPDKRWHTFIHDNNQKEPNVMIMHVNKYTNAALHKHPHKEIWILMHGKIKVYYEDTYIIMSKGDILSIYPETWHTLEVLSNEATIVEIADYPYSSKKKVFKDEI